MLRKTFAISFALSLNYLVSGCAIAPPDVPVCIEEDIGSGFCVNTISGREFTIDDKHPYSPTNNGKNLKSWIDMRPYMMLVPFDSWVEIKKFIINICALTHQCTGTVGNWERSVQTIDNQRAIKQP